MRLDAGGAGPTVALLTHRWASADETGWALRQVAGALAQCADVHVVTPEGATPRERADSVFTVHELASEGRTARIRRDLALAALVEARPPPSEDSVVREVYELLCEEPGDPWRAATQVLRRIDPDLVLIAGYRELGALRALEGGCPEVPMLLVPLRPGSPPGAPLARAEQTLFAPLLERARSILVFTDAERRVFEASAAASSTRWVGLPMGANPSVEDEPNAYVGGADYLLVLSARPLEDERTMPWTQLLRVSQVSRRVAVCASDAWVVYEDGIVLHTPPHVGRGSDLLRLIAWARATVDLHPGPLFARRSLESLLMGTPIVVPHESIARDHAAGGNAGLWFEGPAMLTWCAEALSDRSLAAALGRQGRRYAHARYGSTTSFVEGVLSAAQLGSPGAAARTDANR